MNTIVFQNFMKLQIIFKKKLVDMGLGVDISFEQFLIDLNVNEKNYIFALWSIFKKPTLFLKRKVNDIPTNSFNIHATPIWEANIDV